MPDITGYNCWKCSGYQKIDAATGKCIDCPPRHVADDTDKDRRTCKAAICFEYREEVGHCVKKDGAAVDNDFEDLSISFPT